MAEYTLVLSLALLFGPGCDEGCPVLTGKDTPVGTYTAFPTQLWGYSFMSQGNHIWAVHPVWHEERVKLFSESVEKRTDVTAGCVNMLPEQFEMLPKKRFKLTIKG